MINNPTCLQTFQTGKSSTFTTIQPGQAWPESRTTDAVSIQKGNKNNTVQQLCVTEMATPALGFTGTIVEKEKAASCVVSVVKGKHGDGRQVKSNLPSVAGTRQ